MKLVILCLTILFGISAQAKNSFPNIEGMAQKQAVKNLIENGDLSMIYENMKAGNWSVAETQLETYRNRLKEDKQNYPPEPSSEDVNWLVSAFDREISKGMGQIKEKELQEHQSEVAATEKTDDGKIVKQGLDAMEAKYNALVVSKFVTSISAEKLDEVIKDFRQYDTYRRASPRFKTDNGSDEDYLYFLNLRLPDEYGGGLGMEQNLEALSNAMAEAKTQNHKFSNPIYGKFNELLQSGVPKLIAVNADNAKKAAAQEQKDHAAADARAKEEDRLAGIKNNTKECKAAKAKRNYCNAMMVKGGMERTIANETEIGKETGFVNARKLHGAGSTKIYMDQQSKKASAEYNSITGKTINRSVCGISGNQISAKIEEDVERLCGTID